MRRNGAHQTRLRSCAASSRIFQASTPSLRASSNPNLALLCSRGDGDQAKSVSFREAAQKRLLSGSSSQSDRFEDSSPNRFYPVYVHQVSKTVLMHLQGDRSDWLIAHGLDRGLKTNSSGTFVLQFPSRRPGMDAGRIWTSYDSVTQQHWLSIYRHKLLARFLLKDASKSPRNTHYRYTVSSQSEQEIRTAVERMIETLEARIGFKDSHSANRTPTGPA